jgi:hypothetical protein
MALLFIDGFDHYSTSEMEHKWHLQTGSPTIASSSGRNSTGALSATTTGYLTRWFDEAKYTITCGFAWQQSANATGTMFSICTSTNTQNVISLGINTSNQFTVTSTSLLGTTTFVASNNLFHYIEFQVFLDNTNGSYELRVDGDTKLSDSGVDTIGTGTTPIGFNLGRISGSNYLIDDFYILDDVGSDNVDFLGDVRVETIFPSAVGNTTNFSVTGAATNHEAVDDATPDDDTSYVSSSTVTDKDTYDFDTLVTTSGTVYGVQSNLWARKDISGDRTFRDVIRSGGTDYTGNSKNPGIDYQYFVDMHENNPNGDVDWTISSVNSAEFGFEIES